MEAIPPQWFRQLEASAPCWMGAFTRLEVLVAVRACSASGRCLFYEVQDTGCLHQVETEAPEVADCVFQRIRVLGISGRSFVIDPGLEVLESGIWRLWAWECRPLARVQWDPGEWFWRVPRTAADAPEVPFFQYTARLGRQILAARRDTVSAATVHWQAEGLPYSFLSAFWTRLWGSW